PAYVTMQHQVIAPARNARPPEDDAREADEQYGRGAEAVHRAARLAREQIVVQFDELADEPVGEPHFGFLFRRRCPHVELVTIDEHAARDADEEHVEPEPDAAPEMHLKQRSAQPHPLWLP